jgi:hypothetical protein
MHFHELFQRLVHKRHAEHVPEKLSSLSHKQLAEIAGHDGDREHRVAAVGLLQDQGVLATVAHSDRAEFVRGTAVHRIKSVAILAETARQDASPAVRWTVYEQFDDQSVLAESPRQDPDSGVRWVAVSSPRDAGSPLDVLRKENADRVRARAAERLGALLPGGRDVRLKAKAQDALDSFEREHSAQEDHDDAKEA